MESSSRVKKTLGRQKIKMEKIEKKNHLQVTFSKRRQGLFKKATELAVLCDVQVGIIVQSPAGKVYTFEQPELGLESLIKGISNSPVKEEPLEAEEKEKRYGLWWEDSPIEGLDLRQLEEFLASLEFLRFNVEKQITMI